MLYRCIVALAATVALIPELTAADRWIHLHSGPFEVYSSAGQKPAREALNTFEQLRYALGKMLGKDDLKLVWPVRAVIFRRQAPAIPGGVAMGRDAWIVALPESGAVSPETLAGLTRIFLDADTNRLPPPIEKGLVELFSTLHADGTHLTIGGAPAGAADRDFARMRMMALDAAYSGRTRVFLFDLQQSNDMQAAASNAFEKTPAQIEKDVDASMVRGNTAPGSVDGRAISARDFYAQQVEDDAARLLLADVKLAAGAPDAEAAYKALHGAEAAEGLGFIALRAGNKSEARILFASAAQSGSRNARAWYALALLQPDAAHAKEDFRKAAELNANWAQPPYHLALLNPNPVQKIEWLKKATAMAPRELAIWVELAKTAQTANQYNDAARAWAGALRAAADDAERARIEKARADIAQAREEFLAAERKRKEEEQRRDLERVKNASMAQIRAAEEAARKQLNPGGEQVPVPVMTLNEQNYKTVEGTFVRLDCVRHAARMLVHTNDGQTVRLDMRDPSRVGVSGGVQTFTCGVQRPQRRVVVQYTPEANVKRGVAGDVQTIEYR